MGNDLGLFTGTATYYSRFRPRYPPELLRLLVEHAGLDGTGRLLDLGTGPGAEDVDESWGSSGSRRSAARA
jgi:hypothetical protein